MTEQQLHDRGTRGETLSDEEQAHLQAWYARLDGEERAELDKVVPSASLVALQTQIDAALVQITTLSQHIRTLRAENADLRQEVALLQTTLAKKSTAQPA